MNNIKVLIVDDDPDFGSFIRMKLAREAPQFSIARVEGGPQCLEYLKTNPVDCIISDYQMPGMDGMELLLALRGSGIDAPFIFFTAQGNEEVAREAFKNGAHDYFTKEFGFAHFARIINSVEQAIRRRDAEKAFKEQEFWINESQKVARLGSYMLDIQTGIWTSSDILDDIFGIQKDYDRTVDGWVELLHPEDRDRMVQYFKGVLSEKKKFQADYRIIRKVDGEERWVSGLGELVIGHNGDPVKMLGTIQDVTERKQTEEALRASESKFRSIYSDSPVGIELYSAEGRLIDANPACLSIFGISDIRPVIGFDIFADPNLPGNAKEKLRAGEPVGYETDFDFELVNKHKLYETSKSGKLKLEVFITPLNTKGETDMGYLVHVRDITDRKLAEDALKASQKYLQAIIDTEPECVKLLAPNGAVLMMNRAGLDMIEAESLEQVKGQPVVNLITPEYREAFMELNKEVVKGGTGTLEFDMVGLKGRPLRLETHAVPLRNENDKIVAALGITRDITERKRAVEELKFKNALLAAQQDVSIDGILLVGENDEIISYNRRFVEMWRIPPDIIASKSDAAALKSVLDELKEPDKFLDRVKYLYEHRTEKCSDELHLKDGRTFDRYTAPMYGDDGRYYGRVWYFRDITVRKHIEEMLHESELRLRAILDNIPDLAWLKDRESRFIAVNKPFGNACGLSPASLVGKTDLDIWPKELAESYRADDRKVIETGIQESVEEPLVDKEGNRTWIHTIKSPIRDSDGEIVGTVGIARDITQRKKVEDELKKFKFIVDFAGEEFYLMDTSGNIVYANDAAARSFGYTMDEMLRLNVKDFNLEYAPIFDKYVGRLKERDIPPFETVHTTKDGRKVPKEVKAACLSIGGKDYICTFARDISDRKNLERQRTDFYAMVTHDLKSPLTSILGYSELIATGAKSDENTGAMAKSITRSGEKVLRLVEDFMTAAMIESGGIHLRVMNEDLAGLLREVSDESVSLAAKKGITFRTEIPDAIPKAPLDKKQVERAVGNLLQNALNYTPRGGTVTLTAETISDDSGRFTLISVSDNGPGISQQERDAIFNKYYRSSKTAGTKGTGLGLAIVKAVAEAHGGRVEVESEEGKGSTFRLLLPVGS